MSVTFLLICLNQGLLDALWCRSGFFLRRFVSGNDGRILSKSNNQVWLTIKRNDILMRFLALIILKTSSFRNLLQLKMHYFWEQSTQECVHESTRQSCYMPSHRLQLKVYPKTQKDKVVSVLVFPGMIDHPPVFLGFHQGNRLKIGKMYEALTAMVFNQLLWEFAHILLHT